MCTLCILNKGGHIEIEELYVNELKITMHLSIKPAFILELELLESNDSYTKFWWDI